MKEPADQLLWALGFKYVSESDMASSRDLKALKAVIGPRPYDYARTDRIDLGRTLARDVNGELFAIRGQFDLGFHARFNESGRVKT